MSEVTGAAAQVPPVESPAAPAPAAPEAPETVQPAAQPEELELVKGEGRSGARRNVRKRAERMAREAEARNKAEAARDRAIGQSRKPAGTPEGGEFAKDGTSATEQAPDAQAAAPGAPADTAGAAAAPPAGSQVEPSPAGTAPEGWVDIPLPEGHPWRERGRTHHRVPKDQEREGRAGVNAALRLRDTEAEVEALRRENALLEARRNALSGNLPNVESDPRYKALFDQISEAPGFGPEMAEQIKAALQAAPELKVMKAEQEASAQIEFGRTAHRIASQIEAKSAEVLGIWAKAGELQARLHGPHGLIPQYYAAVDARNTREQTDVPPSPDEFFQWVRQAYAADPRVQAEIQRIRREDQVRSEEQIRAKVRAELAEEQRQKAQEIAERHKAKPPTSRALPSTSSTPSTEAAPTREPPKFGQGRNAAKARIRERYGSP